MFMLKFLRFSRLVFWVALPCLVGTSCSTPAVTNSGPGEVRFNQWISCVPDHPESTEMLGKIKMREPGWKLFPGARDRDATVYRTWLHYDEERLIVDDKTVAGSYRYGRDTDKCIPGEGNLRVVSVGSHEQRRTVVIPGK